MFALQNHAAYTSSTSSPSCPVISLINSPMNQLFLCSASSQRQRQLKVMVLLPLNKRPVTLMRRNDLLSLEL